jgi:hypothetical protein
MWWRYTLIFVAGGIVMYIVLSYLSHKTVSSDATWKATKRLLATQQASNLIKTKEFRDIVLTSEFRDIILTLADEQIMTVANSLSTQQL